MFRPSSSKYKALEAAEKVFIGLGKDHVFKVLKYHVLATLAKSEGWCHDGKMNEGEFMYQTLRLAIKEGDTRFTFHGRGYFSYTEHNITEYDIPKTSAEKRMGSNNPALIEIQEERNEYVYRVCGQCKFIKFNGIKEVTMEGGICTNGNVNKSGVQYGTKACSLWHQRSERQIQTDHEKSALLTIALNKIKTNKIRQSPKRKTDLKKGGYDHLEED